MSGKSLDLLFTEVAATIKKNNLDGSGEPELVEMIRKVYVLDSRNKIYYPLSCNGGVLDTSAFFLLVLELIKNHGFKEGERLRQIQNEKASIIRERDIEREKVKQHAEDITNAIAKKDMEVHEKAKRMKDLNDQISQLQSEVRSLTRHPISEMAYENMCYDWVFNIEKIEEGVRGWEVHDYTGNLDAEVNRAGVVTVAMIGFYGTGKSYIHSKIANTNLPGGAVIHTRGLSVKSFPIPRTKGIIKELVDIAGFQSCVSLKKEKKEGLYGDEEEEDIVVKDGKKKYNKLLLNKKRDEEFIYRLSLRLSSIFVIVVSQMTMLQQVMIEEVKNEIRGNPNNRKEVYVIHNLKNIILENNFNQCIQETCASIYDAQEIVIQPIGCETMITYYQEERDGPEDPIVRHFFLGREGTPAGRKNDAVFQHFRAVQMANNPELNAKSFKVRLMEQLNDLVPRFVNQVPGKECMVYDMNDSYTKPSTEDEEEGEESIVPVVKKRPDNIVHGRLRFQMEESKDGMKIDPLRNRRSHLNYKWHPNVSFGGESGLVGTMGGGTYKPANDRVTIKNMEEDLVYQIILDVPGIKKTTIKRVQGRGKLMKFGDDQKEVGVAYGLWKFFRGKKVLHVMFKRKTKIESGNVHEYHHQERSDGDWEQKFKLPINTKPESIKVNVGDGIVTFSCEMYDDDD